MIASNNLTFLKREAITMQHTELRRTGKFLLFSCSAGLIELEKMGFVEIVTRT